MKLKKTQKAMIIGSGVIGAYLSSFLLKKGFKLIVTSRKIKKRYDTQSDPRYAAARLWIDEIIDPRETRNVLIKSLEITAHQTKMPEPKFGVLQV